MSCIKCGNKVRSLWTNICLDCSTKILQPQLDKWIEFAKNNGWELISVNNCDAWDVWYKFITPSGNEVLIEINKQSRTVNINGKRVRNNSGDTSNPSTAMAGIF